MSDSILKKFHIITCKDQSLSQWVDINTRTKTNTIRSTTNSKTISMVMKMMKMKACYLLKHLIWALVILFTKRQGILKFKIIIREMHSRLVITKSNPNLERCLKTITKGKSKILNMISSFNSLNQEIKSKWTEWGKEWFSNLKWKGRKICLIINRHWLITLVET